MQKLYYQYGPPGALTTVDLSGDGYLVLDGFAPQPGSDPDETTVDQFRLMIRGSTEAELESRKNAISLAHQYGRGHKDGIDGCWLYYVLSEHRTEQGGEAAWRTRVVNGDMLPGAGLHHDWRQRKFIADVIVEHLPYWDGPEAQVPLTNVNGTDNTSGLNIFNCDDRTGSAPNQRTNLVGIDGADISGDLPGPARLEITNTYNESARLNDIYIGHSTHEDANFPNILEAEAATGGTPRVSATCSGGYSSRKALASGSEQELFTWSLTAAQMSACGARPHKIILRWDGIPSLNVKYRLKVQYLITDLWKSELVSLDTSRATQIRDMFTVRIPPWLAGYSNLSALDLVLSGYQETGSSVNIDLDYLALMPLDGWRYVYPNGYGVLYPYRVVDDAINGELYRDNGSGSSKVGLMTGFGNQIHLAPGKNQYLYFLMHSNIMNTGEVDRSAKIKLFYRPRRRCL